ncbi:FtsH protease activity modulator HflK [Luminiphilus sp.]|nr:FtsH protease activity modulator HflK [Luminiphilus sp.]MDA9625566.1 FtsH protease activity modulator HflK [Luminiphilus sp.]
MSWNEPGGGNKGPRDPWGGGNQGPPDLDEAFKKLQQQFASLFGGGRGGSSGKGPVRGGLSGGLIGVVFGGALLVWGLMGFYQLDEQERAVVLRFGEYHATLTPGLQWNPPLIDEVITVNTTKVRASSLREVMLTQDENIVEISMSVQYVIANPQDFVLQVRDPEVSLQHAAQSALRHVVGGTTMDLALTEGRAAIGLDVRDRLQQYLNDYTTGIQVSKINIDESKPPAQVQGAFDDVIKAREDEERVKNEAQSYANGIVPEARGGAQRVLEESNAYRDQVIARADGEAQRFDQLLTEYRKAPDVTRERLYLDTMQEVLANTNKVMVDVEGGNNVLYLPLDKMVPNAGQSRSAASRNGVSERDLREISDQVTEQLRRDLDAAATRRGGR